jgi:DNA polymerase III delta subunit
MKTSPVSFIKGDELYFHNQILSAVRKLNYEELDFSDLSEREVYDRACTSSFFDQNYILVKNTDKFKGAVKYLPNYLKSPVENNHLIFDGVGDVNTPLGKILDDRVITYNCKSFSPYKKDIEKWMVLEVAEHDVTLSENLASTIRQNIGDDLFALHHALHKLLLVTEDKLITRETISLALSRTITTQIFEITNIFGERDLSRLLKLVDIFYRQEDDPTILIASILMNHIENMIRAKSLLDYGLEAKEASQILKMSPWIFQEKLAPQLKKYTIDELIHIHTELCKIDILIKSSSLDGRSILENFLIHTIRS